MIYSGALVILHLKLQDKWQIIGGMRNVRLLVNTQLIDSSGHSSNGWRELLPEAGLRQVNISGSGAFTNSEAERNIQELALTGKFGEYKITFGNGGSLSGKFQISHYERLSEMTSEEGYVISLESSGALV